MMWWYGALTRWLSEQLRAVSRVVTLHTFKQFLMRKSQRVTYKPIQGSLMYLAASALPYHISGYTTRTHEIVCALRAVTQSMHILTRPGYPWDRKDREAGFGGLETWIGEVCYHHSISPSNNRPTLLYALQAAKVIAKEAAKNQVALIHAASNHVNALPALLAARRLGIPFQYEMRGLWELTRISRMPDYEGSQAYKQGLQLEQLVAKNADRLFVISEQLGKYVMENWGVDEKRIALLPNCVNPDLFVPVSAEMIDANTIGYAGSLIGYEGLDTLIDAVDLLVKIGSLVRVTIIGDGEARGQLEAQVQRLGLVERVQFLGKLSPEAARESLGRCALVCIPRKPYKVCQIIPPIKLVEALAMGKPVIVPDLPVFRDELGSSGGGWFFRSGDKEDLAQVISKVIGDQAVLDVAGRKARQHAVSQRNWQDHIRGIVLSTGASE